MVLNALMGKGLQVDKRGSKRSVPVFVPSNTTKKDGGLVLSVNCRPPPFLGTWDQCGNGKKIPIKEKVCS